MTGKQTARHKERETCRQTNRMTGKQTARHKERETCRQTDRMTGKQTARHVNKVLLYQKENDLVVFDDIDETTWQSAVSMFLDTLTHLCFLKCQFSLCDLEE